jgi:hypothetical protein
MTSGRNGRLDVEPQSIGIVPVDAPATVERQPTAACLGDM